MWEKINKLKNWQASLVIALIGFIAYFDGLRNHFQGDDLPQIVNNTQVHSLANIGHFFTAGTFFDQSIHSLAGVYYRPLMTTTFSFLYNIFGAHALGFHLFQLLVSIGSAIILYLFFRYSFSLALSLILALIFLVHPINSQAVFAIPSMQDTLFFFFGILAMYLILRFRSTRSLLLVALCLTLSLLSKETGIFFVFMAAILLFVWDRPRFRPYLYIMIAPIVLWFGLRVHAVHLFTNPYSAPIDSASLKVRLLTLPSIIQFYLTKLILPVKLGSGYYWVYRSFSLSHVLVPLIIDLLVLGLIIYAARLVNKKASKAQYYTFWFFAVWFFAGLFSLSQIIPLDLTACTLWFYFPMVGVLGMIGVVIQTKAIKINWPNWSTLTIVCVLICSYVGLTMYQGLQWKSDTIRDNHDISVSKGNYLAYQAESIDLIKEGKYEKAKDYAIDSVNVYPDYSNYYSLGAAYYELGDFESSLNAFNKATRYGVAVDQNPNGLYDNMANIIVYSTNDYATYRQFIEECLSRFSNDPILWTDLALLDQKNGDNKDAKQEITTALKYGQVTVTVYDGIMQNKTFVTKMGPDYVKI